MKIIKDGRLEWSKTVKCHGCKSTLEITGEDIEYWIHYDYGGGSDPVTSVQCPVCDKTIHLSDVPDGFTEIARKKYHAEGKAKHDVYRKDMTPEQVHDYNRLHNVHRDQC